MPEPFWHIKNCVLFEQLTDERLSWLESRCRTRQLPGKSPIYLPADSGNSVFLLSSGRAKICHITPDGKQSILAFIEPGELFGELALVSDGTRDEYAETLEKSQIVMIPGDVFPTLMEETPALAIGVNKLIGIRRKRIEQRLKNLLFQSNRERLTHLLLELAEQYGTQTSGGVELGIKLSHQELASVIGATRETVTVVLGELQEEGLVTVGRRKITIISLPALAESVHREAPTLRQEEASTRPMSAVARPAALRTETI